MVLYGHRNRIVYYGALRPHKLSALLWCFTSTETVCFIMVLYVHSNRILYYVALRPQKPYSLLCCFTSTETVWPIRDGRRKGWGMRALAHIPIHTAPELCYCNQNEASFNQGWWSVTWPFWYFSTCGKQISISQNFWRERWAKPKSPGGW